MENNTIMLNDEKYVPIVVEKGGDEVANRVVHAISQHPVITVKK